MKAVQFALTLGLCLLALAGQASAQQKISIPTVTPTDRASLLTHKAPAATVSGDLYLPKGAGPFPALVLKHGSGGLEGPTGDNVRKWAATVTGWGIAAFVVDSFGPRGIKDTAENQAQLANWADIADALAGLKVLAADPRIDKTRIGIIGWSRGGNVAYMTALESVRKAVIADELKFALHIVFYGAANTQYRDKALDQSPFLFFHGEADNYVPMAPTREYADWVKSMGVAVTFISYPKTFHDFDVATGFQGFAPKVETGITCDLVVDTPTGKITRMGHKDQPALVAADALSAYLKTCVGHGANLAYNATARADAVEKVQAFLKANFHL